MNNTDTYCGDCGDPITDEAPSGDPAQRKPCPKCGEVAVERSLSAAFAAKGLQYLEDPVLDFLNGYNLGNDRNRKLYTALTNDNIEQKPFWPAFKESATRRNNIVHGGAVVGQVEAEGSYQAARALVAHLNQ